jgi:hypothetical protein
MKNKLLFRLLSILLVFISCSSDSDNTTNVSDLNIEIQALNYNSATITWNAIQGSGTVSYNIFLSDNLEAELISDLTYSFTNLNENTNYTIRVDALDDSGVIKSKTLSFTTIENTTVELTPSAFTTSVKHLGHVSTTIQWTSSTVSDGSPVTYSVFVGGQIIASDLNNLKFYIPNLEANTTYNGVVRAYNGSVFTDSNFSFTTVPSNIFTGRVTLKTQLEVNNFAAQHYTEITDWLIIGTSSVTSDINDLSGLQSLIKVTGSLFVSYNPNLASTHGLQNISNDINAIAIVDNTILNDLSGFSGINKLLGYINIVNNPQIATLDAFSNMTTGVSNVNVELTNNDMLVDIDGLSQLNLFAVYIRENQLLANINLINSSDSNSLGLLYIMNNPSLNDFSPLSNITLIKGSLTIANSNLTNLNDLSNLNRTFGDVNIFYNSALTNLCGLQNIVQSNNINGLYNVHHNAYNPTFQNINTGNCSQ